MKTTNNNLKEPNINSFRLLNDNQENTNKLADYPDINDSLFKNLLFPADLNGNINFPSILCEPSCNLIEKNFNVASIKNYDSFPVMLPHHINTFWFFSEGFRGSSNTQPEFLNPDDGWDFCSLGGLL